MPTKPTVKPKWAEVDQIDPSSGQSNVVEPPEGRKDSGWNRREIPPRQWFNWLHRFYYRWIDWLDGTTIPLTSTDVTTNNQPSDGTGHTHQITGFLRTSELFQEIEDAGAAAQLEAIINLGYEEFTYDLSGDPEFTSGTIKFVKFGSKVNVIVTDTSFPTTTSGFVESAPFIPSQFRPGSGTGDVALACIALTLSIDSYQITDSGRFRMFFKDYTGAAYDKGFADPAAGGYVSGDL